MYAYTKISPLSNVYSTSYHDQWYPVPSSCNRSCLMYSGFEEIKEKEVMMLPLFFSSLIAVYHTSALHFREYVFLCFPIQ